jgi:hypothetical protein
LSFLRQPSSDLCVCQEAISTSICKTNYGFIESFATFPSLIATSVVCHLVAVVHSQSTAQRVCFSGRGKLFLLLVWSKRLVRLYHIYIHADSERVAIFSKVSTWQYKSLLIEVRGPAMQKQSSKKAWLKSLNSVLVVSKYGIILLFTTKYIYSPITKASRFLLFYSLAGFY